jgi:uncharacterized membrane protein YkvA (DUF1232 family)
MNAQQENADAASAQARKPPSDQSGSPTASATISSAQQELLERELFARASHISREDEKVVAEQLPEKMSQVLESAHRRLPAVKNMLGKVKTLYAMMRDKDFSMAWTSKTLVIAGLLYFISPIDLLPDYIPVLGYIDDAFVISLVMNAVATEIERYGEYIGRKQ